MRASCVLLAVSLALAGTAAADAPPKLWEHGAPITLADGLRVRPDRSVWISRRDLTDGLGIVVRELIPPVGNADRKPRKKRKPPRRAFVLSQHDFSVRFDERKIDATTVGNEVFPLKAVAKGLGWSLETRDGGYNLVPTGKGARRGTKPGDRFPDLVLEGLGGEPKSTSGPVSFRSRNNVSWPSISLQRSDKSPG